MVLDSIVNREFVFKNTQRDNVQVTVPVDASEAPNEFYFVHIKVKEDKIEEIKRRLTKKTRKWKHEQVWFGMAHYAGAHNSSFEFFTWQIHFKITCKALLSLCDHL